MSALTTPSGSGKKGHFNQTGISDTHDKLATRREKKKKVWALDLLNALWGSSRGSPIKQTRTFSLPRLDLIHQSNKNTSQYLYFWVNLKPIVVLYASTFILKLYLCYVSLFFFLFFFAQKPALHLHLPLSATNCSQTQEGNSWRR